MVQLNLSPGLTRPLGDVFEENLVRTHQGMAHFAGTGPVGATCKGCTHFSTPSHAAAARAATCQKYQRLTGKQGQKIPPSADACKYFERRAQP